jgi:hypothetical protein
MARMASIGVLLVCCALAFAVGSAAASAPPDAPVLTGTNPPSPGNRVHIFVQGTAPPGTTVSVYPTGDCSGPPYPSGSAATLASPGVEVQVPDASTTYLSATATDATAGVSACSAPISYLEDSRPPHTIIGRLHANQTKGTITPVFSSDEPHSTFECRTVSRWGRCISGQRTWHIRPRPGRRGYFRVRATDAAGNVDASPAVKTVT